VSNWKGRSFHAEVEAAIGQYRHVIRSRTAEAEATEIAIVAIKGIFRVAFS
jgi:hypothetical protein